MRNSSPFSRFNSLMSMAAAMMLAQGVSRPEAFAKLGEYKSRGHGRGKYSGIKMSASSKRKGKYMPHQGKQEIARRSSSMYYKHDPVYSAVSGKPLTQNPIFKSLPL